MNADINALEQQLRGANSSDLRGLAEVAKSNGDATGAIQTIVDSVARIYDRFMEPIREAMGRVYESLSASILEGRQTVAEADYREAMETAEGRLRDELTELVEQEYEQERQDNERLDEIEAERKTLLMEITRMTTGLAGDPDWYIRWINAKMLGAFLIIFSLGAMALEFMATFGQTEYASTDFIALAVTGAIIVMGMGIVKTGAPAQKRVDVHKDGERRLQKAFERLPNGEDKYGQPLVLFDLDESTVKTARSRRWWLIGMTLFLVGGRTALAFIFRLPGGSVDTGSIMGTLAFAATMYVYWWLLEHFSSGFDEDNLAILNQKRRELVTLNAEEDDIRNPPEEYVSRWKRFWRWLTSWRKSQPENESDPRAFAWTAYNQAADTAGEVYRSAVKALISAKTEYITLREQGVRARNAAIKAGLAQVSILYGLMGHTASPEESQRARQLLEANLELGVDELFRARLEGFTVSQTPPSDCRKRQLDPVERGVRRTVEDEDLRRRMAEAATRVAHRHADAEAV